MTRFDPALHPQRPGAARRRRPLAWLAALATAAATASWWLPVGSASAAFARAPHDDVAFAVVQRAAEMHAFCDPMDSAVRGHCERCYTLANPLPCAALAGADPGRCTASDEHLANCLQARSATVDGCIAALPAHLFSPHPLSGDDPR